MIVYINLSTSTFCNIDVLHFHFHLSIVNLSFTLSNLTSTFFHLIQLFCILPASFFLKFNSSFTVFRSKTLFYVGTYTAFLLSNFLLQLVLLLLLLLLVFCNLCFYFLSTVTFASTSCLLQLLLLLPVFCNFCFFFLSTATFTSTFCLLQLLLLCSVFCNFRFYFLSSAIFASTSCILQLFCSIFFYFIIIQFSLNSTVPILIIFLYNCLLFTVRSCTAIVLMW